MLVLSISIYLLGWVSFYRMLPPEPFWPRTQRMGVSAAWPLLLPCLVVYVFMAMFSLIFNLAKCVR